MNRLLLQLACMLLMMLCSSNAHAQAKSLVVWQKSGEKVYYDLEERPKTTFSGTDIVIETSSMTITYPLEQLLRYTYETNPAGISHSKTSKDMIVSQRGDMLTFENLKRGSTIHVYSIDGTMLNTLKVDKEPMLNISLSAYPTGIYIIKADQVIYKIMKR